MRFIGQESLTMQGPSEARSCKIGKWGQSDWSVCVGGGGCSSSEGATRLAVNSTQRLCLAIHDSTIFTQLEVLANFNVVAGPLPQEEKLVDLCF